MAIGTYGWQEAFLITGALGFVWLIFWWLFYEIPSRHKKIKTPEYEYIHSDSEDIATPDQKPIKWAKLVQLPQTWVFIS